MSQVPLGALNLSHSPRHRSCPLLVHYPHPLLSQNQRSWKIIYHPIILRKLLPLPLPLLLPPRLTPLRPSPPPPPIPPLHLLLLLIHRAAQTRKALSAMI